MRVLPVIRCPPGEAAQMIAERLEDYTDLSKRSANMVNQIEISNR